MAADPGKLKVVKQLARQDILFGLARVPDSSRLFFGSSDAKVYSVDMAEEKPEPKPFATHGSYVTSVALAGEQVISGSYDQLLVWSNAKTLEQVRSVPAHERWIRQIVTAPNGKYLVSIADDMVARVCDPLTGDVQRTVRFHEKVTPHHYPSMLYACAISPDSQYVATGDRVGHVAVWEAATGKLVTSIEATGMYTWDPNARRHSIGGIRSLAFSPDGERLVVGGMSQVGNIDHPDAPGRVEIFDWKSGKRTHEFLADGKLKGMVQQIIFHPSGEWFVGAGGGYGGFILFYDVKQSKMIFQDSAPMHVHGLASNEDCDTLYATGHNKLLVWELKA